MKYLTNCSEFFYNPTNHIIYFFDINELSSLMSKLKKIGRTIESDEGVQFFHDKEIHIDNVMVGSDDSLLSVEVTYTVYHDFKEFYDHTEIFPSSPLIEINRHYVKDFVNVFKLETVDDFFKIFDFEDSVKATWTYYSSRRH